MDFVLIGIFELLMLVLILQSIVICWLAFRPRKPDEKWIIKKEVKSEPPEDDVPDTDMASRPTPPLPLPRTRSHFNYYVIWKSDTDNSVPTGIYHCTWDEMIPTLPNNRFPAKGIRLKGANSLDEACRVWRQHRTAEMGI